MDPVSVAAAFVTLVIVYRVYHRYARISLADVPGPESASFVMGVSTPFSLFPRLMMWPSGNLKELYQGQAAEADFKWQAQYGDVIRFKGPLGVCDDICTHAIHVLIRWFTGRSIDDFRPCRLAVHLLKIRLSVPKTERSMRPLAPG
jgi:hypothetical protein